MRQRWNKAEADYFRSEHRIINGGTSAKNALFETFMTVRELNSQTEGKQILWRTDTSSSIIRLQLKLSGRNIHEKIFMK